MTARRYATFAWAFLGYTLLVILWGAFVRATGSGAGCGDHWPLCNGEVVPRTGATATLIELTHRVTSGLSWLGAAIGAWWAFRAYDKGHRVRTFALLGFVFMSTEGLVGAALVLREMVADNASYERGFWMALHLVNTFLLLATMTLTAYFASGGRRVSFRGRGLTAAAVALATAGVLFLGMSGAIAALGDTLFPAESLEAALRDDLSPAAHLFVRLRVFHPLIGLLVGAAVVLLAGRLFGLTDEPFAKRLGGGLVVLFAAQVGLGFLNVALLAPVWLQLVHLLVADLIWIALILASALALAAEVPSGEAPARFSVKRAEDFGS